MISKSKANAQTRATAKYQKKAGLVTKGFKLKGELADEFKETCERIGVSQASAISKFMREFIEAHKEQ